MISVSISIDVPDMDEGIRFYEGAFGFAKAAEPFPGVVVLRAGGSDICLLEKEAGSRPSPGTQETRHYERHWTPVPFCSDPFGHGFCIIERRKAK
jgi:hypothetical protein